MLSKIFIISLLTFFTYSSDAESASNDVELIKQNWPFNGIFGRFDKSSLQRGFKVYSEVCAACHGIRHISYRDLADIGYSPDEIKAIAGEYEVIDGPNDEGDMYAREAKMSENEPT